MKLPDLSKTGLHQKAQGAYQVTKKQTHSTTKQIINVQNHNTLQTDIQQQNTFSIQIMNDIKHD